MIHFFKIELLGDGRKIFSMLEGQKYGNRDIHAGALVKAGKGSESVFQRTRSGGSVGEVFFSRTVREAGLSYTAKDLQSTAVFDGKDGRLNLDVQASLEWEKWKCDNADYPAPDCGEEDLPSKAKRFAGVFLRYDNLDYGYYVCRDVVKGIRVDMFIKGKMCEAGLNRISSDGDGVSLEFLSPTGESETVGFDALPCGIQKELYRDMVAIALHISLHREDVVRDGEWKLIDGVAFVPVCWPEVQNFFYRRGFRKHSILINEEPEYSRYGDSAYWVEAGWLEKQE